MTLSLQSHITTSHADAAGKRDVLDLATENSAPAERATDFSRIKIKALFEWESLLDGHSFPPATAIDGADTKLIGPASVLFSLPAGTDQPEIAHVGSQVLLAQEAAQNDSADGLISAGSLPAQLTELCARALSCREPFDFDLDPSDGFIDASCGMILPFSNDGERIDHVLCIFDTPERNLAVADAPGADIEAADPKMEARREELLLEQELEPKEMPNLSGSNVPEETDPFLLINMGANAAARRPVRTAQRESSLFPLPRPRNELVIAEPTPGLVDYLAEARGLAEAANVAQTRTRGALYRAIGCAYDFALAAVDAPADYADIAAQAGLKMQARAPMTPVVKLVFGADYDRTRLTEYATVLSYALNLGLERGTFEQHLLATQGGLKEIVRTERARRRLLSGQPVSKPGQPRETLARKLRAMPALALSELAPDGDEFVLLLARRDDQTGVSVVGEVPRDIPMLERAARKLIADQKN